MILCWFVGLLLVLAQSVLARSGHIFVSAPNIVRVGNIETVLVNVFNTDQEAAVTVTLKNVDKSEISPPQTYNVQSNNPHVVRLFIDPDNIPVVDPEDEDALLYVKLGVTCPQLNFNEEKELLVSYEEGFVFIQTDKPIYTPDQSVSIRLLILDQYLRPSDQTVQLDVLSPQNVTVNRISDIQTQNGFKTHIFKFPHEPLFGNWTVVASYGKELRTNRSVQFEVKEYVLPTFSVRLTPPEYILPGDEVMTFTVNARYVYDKPVRGHFFAKVGIREFDGDITIKKKMTGETMANGLAHFQMETAELGDNWFFENEGKRLYVEVSVLESATGISENVSDTSAMFVDSPYTFRWDRTIRYFKKGLPYQVKVDLLLANGMPARSVPVEVIATGLSDTGEEAVLWGEQDENGNRAPTQSFTNYDGQVNFRLDAPENCESIHVMLETKDALLIRQGADGQRINDNAVFEFEVEPHISPSVDDFLLIRLFQDIVTIDEDLTVEALVATDDNILWLAYYVVSKGTISSAGMIHGNLRVQGFRVRITYDMAPSARIVAFYINQAGQVIADSLWIEISKVCENQVHLRVVGDPVLEPDQNVTLHVDALPTTTVGLLAVDKAVYLLRDYHRLTKDKMYQTMDTYDAGCGPGGGRDSPSIFKNAGIMVLSSATLDVGRREAHGCVTPLNPRRRRDISDELIAQFAHYNGTEWFSCKRGLRLLGAGLTCEERVERFQTQMLEKQYTLSSIETDHLKRIFLECCEAAEAHRQDENRGRSGGGQGTLGDPTVIADFAEPGAIRSDFRETWILEELGPVGTSGSIEQAFTLPSSITEWSVSAVGLSRDYAMCVSDPLDVLVRKDLFIQLHMPYSVVRKEQVEIIATVFNYQQEPLRLFVFLRRTEAVCSEGIPNEFSANRIVMVNGNDAVSVKYILIGLEVGEHPIEVEVRSRLGTDAVRKDLRVIPEGIEASFHHSTTIDPAGSLGQPRGQYPQFTRASHSDFRQNDIFLEEEKTQINFFDIRLPSTAVPDSEKCEVSIVGNVLGPVVMTMIEGLEPLIRLPTGCGEQTLVSLVPNIYVIRYLMSLEAATEDLENKAKNFISHGITREQNYRKPDGSFSIWGGSSSSTWLTAFVNKVFCQASDIGVFVDPKVTCQAMEWLINTAQREDGAFFDTYTLHSRPITGGLHGDDALTAFILISLLECECPTLSERVNESKRRAVGFLEGQLDNIDRPYAMAIVTYALALADSGQRHHANLRLRSMDTFDPASGLRHWSADDSGLPDSSSIPEGSKPYWYRARPSAVSVEATGYALLAQLELNELHYSHSIAKWLSEQQNYGGGFASTQDTVIALQALSEYSFRNSGDRNNMTCSLIHNGETLEQFQFTEEDALVQQHATPPAVGSLMVRSVGTGTGKLNVKVTYNTISEELNERQSPFDILIDAQEMQAEELPERPPQHRRGGRRRGRSPEPNGDELIVHVTVEVRYHKNEPTNMAIIDVGLYTGFKPNQEDLEEIVASSEYISRYEVSQRSVVFYADHIPPIGTQPPLRLEFSARREFVVGNLQPVAVKVYDYYNPTEEGVKFYHPTSAEESASTLASVCEGQQCVCAAGDCYDCGPKSKTTLLSKSCATNETYVYRIRILGKLEEIDQSRGFTVYNVEIVEVFKKAGDGTIADGATRKFWASSSCTTCSSRLKKNSNHLVIGKTVLPYVTKESDERYKYILDNSVLTEFWPEKRRKRTQEQYDKLEEFQTDMRNGNNNCQHYNTE